jgi:hypothetical protein
MQNLGLHTLERYVKKRARVKILMCLATYNRKKSTWLDGSHLRDIFDAQIPLVLGKHIQEHRLPVAEEINHIPLEITKAKLCR